MAENIYKHIPSNVCFLLERKDFDIKQNNEFADFECSLLMPKPISKPVTIGFPLWKTWFFENERKDFQLMYDAKYSDRQSFLLVLQEAYELNENVTAEQLNVFYEMIKASALSKQKSINEKKVL